MKLSFVQNLLEQRTYRQMRTFLAAVLIWIIGGYPVRAGIFENGSSDAAHVSLGSNYQGAVLSLYGESFIEGYYTNVLESGTFLDPYNVLFFPSDIGFFSYPVNFSSVSSGNNYSNSPGITSPIFEVIYATNFSLAIAHLARPLPFPIGSGVNSNGGALTLSPVTFAPPPTNSSSNLTGAGFGIFGTLGGTTHPQNGNCRAWEATVDTYTFFLRVLSFSNAYYFSNNFPTNLGPGSLAGEAAQFDAGGGWYDSSGNLIGITQGKIQNNEILNGGTVVVNLSNPIITSWIQSNLYIPATLSFQTLGRNLVFTWPGNNMLQTSTNLNAGFSDITSSSSPYTNLLQNDQQRFFRLRHTNVIVSPQH